MDRRTTKSVGALLALALSTFAYVTTETLPIGLLLPMAGDLHTSEAAIGLLVTTYGLVVVVTSIPLTFVTRRLPRRALLSGLLGVLVAGMVASALAPNYPALLIARLLIALSQALFWSIVIPTAAGLFSSRVQGRVLGIVMSGNSLAAVLGIPAGTWLGQHAGWRVSFLVLAALSLVAMAGVGRLLPGGPAAQGAAARGTTPSTRVYALLILTTALAITGAYAAFTFITPFLIIAAGFTAAAIGPLLLVRGVAGIVGVTAGGSLVDRSPMASMVLPIALQAVALLGLYVLPGNGILVTVLTGAAGLSFAAFTTALGSRVLYVAPRTKDLAAAGASTAINVGITAGAFIGGLLLPACGVRSTVLVGGLLSVAALVAALSEPLLRKPSGASARGRESGSDPRVSMPVAPVRPS